MNVYTDFDSPLGNMVLQANERGLLGAWFETHTTRPAELGEQDDHFPLLKQARQQLDEYFAKQRIRFDLPLAAQGSAFQQQVWQALCNIPYGKSCSYQDIANAIDNPKAVRAVGLANGKNPLSIIVPCHRVIGKNGQLAGYAGGVERKQFLLQLEGIR